MADPPNDSLMREIDEELRQERLLQIWKRYGRIIVSAAVLLIAGVAGYQGWNYYDQGRRAEGTAALVSADRLAETDGLAALDSLESLAHSAPAGPAALAQFRAAALLAEEGNSDAAIDVYRNLTDTAPNPLMRDLARVLYAMMLLSGGSGTVDTGADDVSSILAPVTTDDNPWRYSAREVMALSELQSGNIDAARQTLTGLIGDPLAPPGVRERADRLLAQVDGG